MAGSICSPPTAISKKKSAGASSQKYRQPAQLFWNHGGGLLARRPRRESRRNALFQPIVGRGSAYADIDGDGDLDVLLLAVHGPPLLLRNDQRLGHHFVRLKLGRLQE
jgi:hypothetical protein